MDGLPASASTEGVVTARAGSAHRAGAGLACLVLTSLGLATGLAWGHAALVWSTPVQRAVITRSPDRVRLWFNEPLEAKFARVSVWDGRRARSTGRTS